MAMLMKYGIMEISRREPELDKLEPETAVTITFDDNLTVDGIFICEVLGKCYVVTSLNVPHPPGWYVDRDQITVK